MRIKRVEGVKQVQVVSLKPQPQIYVSYDGVVGLSERPILRDILEEIDRGTVRLREVTPAKGGGSLLTKQQLTSSLRANGWGKVFVYFNDYVSYGAGAGEEVAEFYFRSMLLLFKEANPQTGEPEKLLLQHATNSLEELPAGGE